MHIFQLSDCRFLFLLFLSFSFGCTNSVEEVSQSGIIAATFRWDMRSGQNGSQGDVYLGYKSKSERYIEPQVGNEVALLDSHSYSATTYDDLKALTYSDSRLEHNPDQPKLSVGDSFAIRTADGRYAKVRIKGFRSSHNFDFKGSDLLSGDTKTGLQAKPVISDYHMEVEWTVYSAD